MLSRLILTPLVIKMGMDVEPLASTTQILWVEAVTVKTYSGERCEKPEYRSLKALG